MLLAVGRLHDHATRCGARSPGRLTDVAAADLAANRARVVERFYALIRRLWRWSWLPNLRRATTDGSAQHEGDQKKSVHGRPFGNAANSSEIDESRRFASPSHLGFALFVEPSQGDLSPLV
jgi:hypothetical protein